MKKMIKNTLAIALLLSVCQAFGADLNQESSEFEQVTFHNNAGKEVKITVSGEKGQEGGVAQFVTAPQDYSESKAIAAGESVSFDMGKSGDMDEGFTTISIAKATAEANGKSAELEIKQAGDFGILLKDGELIINPQFTMPKGQSGKSNGIPSWIPGHQTMTKGQGDKPKGIPRFIPGWQTMQKAPASH